MWRISIFSGISFLALFTLYFTLKIFNSHIFLFVHCDVVKLLGRVDGYFSVSISCVALFVIITALLYFKV